jgi:hypothetical protein
MFEVVAQFLILLEFPQVKLGLPRFYASVKYNFTVLIVSIH